MNILYVVPNIEKVSDGPRTRISMFSQIFETHGDVVISGDKKFSKSLNAKQVDLVYVESATNRISFTDFFSLLYLCLVSKKITVFIRDIYIELFPEEFTSVRGRITWTFNKLSNCFLTLISDTMVFPTVGMGDIYFEKNKWIPKREYFALPPGCSEVKKSRKLPDFSRKLGILYLGSVSYTNAGFEHFLNFADRFKDRYNFFVLSGDGNAKKIVRDRPHILLDKIEHSKIPLFLEKYNISVALHTRPINEYDDITFPIKILDFISFQLPFLTEAHNPLKQLLGNEYDLFVDISNYVEMDNMIQKIVNKGKYSKEINFLAKIAHQNTYENRYKEIFGE